MEEFERPLSQTLLIIFAIELQQLKDKHAQHMLLPLSLPTHLPVLALSLPLLAEWPLWFAGAASSLTVGPQMVSWIEGVPVFRGKITLYWQCPVDCR